MHNSAPYDEKEWLRRIAAGDSEAYEMLYNAYRHKFYGFLFQLTRSREMAADVLQDVFLRIWENRQMLKEVDSFSAYFQSMVRNRSLNLLKRIAREDEIIEGLIEKEHASINNSNDPVLYNELRKKIEALIHQLPEQQQKVFRLSREQGMKQEDIARLLNISLPTVKTHLARATQFLRTKLVSALLITWLGNHLS